MADRRFSCGHQEVIGLTSNSACSIRRRTGLSSSCGILFFSILVIAGCTGRQDSGSKEQVVLRIGVPEADVSTPDVGLPQVARYFNVEGLTAKAQDGRSVPRLARSWSSTPDGLEWRFVLRDDVVFHDGTKLTAHVARDSLAASLPRPATRELYPGLADVVELKAASDTELVITLKRRSAFLIDDLEFPITRGEGKSRVGTGPFKIASESANEIVMDRHGSYHQGTPQIDRLVLRPYATLRTAWASLMRQEIDVLWDVSHESAEFVGSRDVEMHSYLRNYVYLVAFNSGSSKLASPAVRRALNAAVDRARLIGATLRGHGLAAYGPLWPHHWAYDASLPGYTFDPSMASSILDAAGLKQSNREGGGPRLSFECLLPQNYAVLERLGLEVQKQLYDIGVDMQLKAVSTEEFDGRIRKGEFEAVLFPMISAPTFARAYQFWRSTNGFRGLNVFGYRSAAADRWFDALRYSANEAEFRAATSQLQRTLLEDPPALFLAWQERTRAISRRFDVRVENGRDPILSLWQWRPTVSSQTN